MYTNLKDSVSQVLKFVNSDVRLSILSSFHYGWSATFFAIACVISTLDNISKTQIDCISGGLLPQEVVNTYCLINSIYSTHRANETMNVRVIDNLSYYIWVPYIFFISFVLTMTGQCLYKHILCGDYLCMLVSNMKLASEFQKNQKLKKKDIKDYLNKLLTKERIKADAGWWVCSYCVMDVVNAFTPFLQFFYLDLFLNGKFRLLGFHFNDQDHYDIVFPKMAKCNLYKVGPSGTPENHDLLCVLSKNILYEKIFVCVWYWLVFMCLIGIASLSWRVVTLICFRYNWFNNCIWRQNGISGSKQYMKYVQFLSKDLSFCPWLYLFYVARNSDLLMFEILLNNMLEGSSFFKCEKKPDKISKEDDESFVTAETSRLFFNIRNLNEPKKKISDNDDADLVIEVESGDSPESGNPKYVLIPYDFGVMDLMQKILIILGKKFGFSSFFLENNQDQMDMQTFSSVINHTSSSDKDDHSSAGSVLEFKDVESQKVSTEASEHGNKNKTLSGHGRSFSIGSEIKVDSCKYSPVAVRCTTSPTHSGNDSPTAPRTVTLYSPEHPERTLPIHELKVLVNSNGDDFSDSECESSK